MMDPYNLAICFGPTLMSVPEGHDQVSCQAHVNELIKTIIIHHDGIFPGLQELPGPIYSVPRAGEDFWSVLTLVQAAYLYFFLSKGGEGWVVVKRQRESEG